MSLTPIDLEIDQGDDEVIDIAVKKPDNTALDLTGCKLWFFIKASAVDADDAALITKTSDVDEGITVTDPPEGIANVAIDRADTASLTASQTGRQLPWALQVKDAADHVTTLAKGTIVINRDLIQEVV